MVRVESPGKTQDFIVQASNDGLRQDYALLDPVGMVTLLAGSYDGQTVMSSGPLAEAVPAALPLAAIQLVRWPLDSLRTGLPAPLLVSGDGKRNRFLSKDGRTVLVATLGETTVIQRPDPPLRIVVRRAQQR